MDNEDKSDKEEPKKPWVHEISRPQWPDLIILYSGGADSRLLLELALSLGKYPHCVLIDYGQHHKEELEFAERQLTKLDIKHQTVELSNLQVNSGLTGTGVKNDSGLVHEMHVPSRNLMFVGIAASIAESKEINQIWYGADYSDLLNNFPDCMPDWIDSVNDLLQINGPSPISFQAPLMGFSKELVLGLLNRLGVSENEVYSGYGDL